MTRTEAFLLHATLLLLAVSGAALGVSRYLLPDDDPFSSAGTWWTPWAKAVHVLAAPPLLFAVGLVFRRHVLGRLRDAGSSGRAGGISLIALIGLSAADGYLLQVLTGDALRRVLSIAHLAGGLALAAVYLAHVRLGARARSAAVAPGAPAAARRAGSSPDRSRRDRPGRAPASLDTSGARPG